jgi:hypothetical protein
MIRLSIAVIASILLPGILWAADCAPDYRSNDKSGVFIVDVLLNGTTSLSSVELATIRNKLIGACADEGTDDLEEIVKNPFQDEGYFAANIKSLDVKVLDPLAQPKRVSLEADVAEGQIYKLAEIKFVDNHVFTAAKLRSKFSLHKGDIFKKDRLVGSFGGIRKLYGSRGYLSLAFIPDAENLASATIILTMTMMEGPQYHMGKLRISAKRGMAEQLEGAWKLPEGGVFDSTYPGKFVDANQSQLPAAFTRDSVQLVRNCPEASVEVRIVVDQTDPALQLRPADIKCEKSTEKSK